MVFWYERYGTQNEVALFESHCHRQDELNMGLRVGGCLMTSDHDLIDFKFGKWRRVSTNILSALKGLIAWWGNLWVKLIVRKNFDGKN